MNSARTPTAPSNAEILRDTELRAAERARPLSTYDAVRARAQLPTLAPEAEKTPPHGSRIAVSAIEAKIAEAKRRAVTSDEKRLVLQAADELLWYSVPRRAN